MACLASAENLEICLDSTSYRQIECFLTLHAAAKEKQNKNARSDN
jgi:hypothetical protein